ncbi:MAG: SDR family oxidoreductase [Chloroflexi bacterium]|nr:SDR family oxidoreductase [Chloroflexota bacterium]
MTLEQKVALITGGSSGIGKATAHRLATAGARIGVLGRTPDEVESVTEAIESSGGEAMSLLADVSDAEAMQDAIEQLVSRWQRLDVVFANAGINGVWAPLGELTPQDWDKTINVNLKGTFLTVKYALPYLKRDGGSVIVTSSINGTRVFSNSGATAYACSKAAQVAFVKMAALELAKHGIRVNVICPGAIESQISDNTTKEDLEHIREPVEFPEGQIPLTDGKPGEAEQVADLVLFLASDAASHITGTEVWIDGAQSLLRG